MDRKLVSTSKFLSLVLRHKPETIGLTLDEGGWAEVDELLAKARKLKPEITKDMVLDVVAQNDKQRFALSADNTRIRANQGHSIAVDLELSESVPPEILFHGTASRFIESIFNQGLLPQNRQYVHLSSDRKTALAVGRRHGQPVILEVDAAAMVRDGYPFYVSANGVWLCERVPPAYLTTLPSPL